MKNNVIRIFPNYKHPGKPPTKWTPRDKLCFYDDPPLIMPPPMPVKISVTFTWDIPEAERLYRSWIRYYPDVQIGGPAFNDPGDEFQPGLFLKHGVTITSRGCIRNCKFCLVPKREGKLRELPIKDGWIIQDNNFLACSRSHIEAVFEMLRRQNQAPDFAAGLDARLLKSWHIELFKSLKSPRLWFACDDNRGLGPLAKAAEMLEGLTKYCYVLIGYDPSESLTQAEERLIKVWNLGFYPFAMLYQGPNGEGHKERDWKRFQRKWCRPAAYKSYMKEVDSLEYPAV